MELSTYLRTARRFWIVPLAFLLIAFGGTYIYHHKVDVQTAQTSVAVLDPLIARPGEIEDILQTGARRARALAAPFVARLREAVGLRDLRQVPMAAKARAGARAKAALHPVVFRDDDRAFAFKVLDAKKNVLAAQGGFADPQAAMAAAREAMGRLAGG